MFNYIATRPYFSCDAQNEASGPTAMESLRRHSHSLPSHFSFFPVQFLGGCCGRSLGRWLGTTQKVVRSAKGRNGKRAPISACILVRTGWLTTLADTKRKRSLSFSSIRASIAPSWKQSSMLTTTSTNRTILILNSATCV